MSSALQRLIESDAVRRLVERDPSLFAENTDARIAISQRLGWTGLASNAPGRFPLLHNLAAALRDEGCTDICLLGMGGSSLAPLVISRIIGSAPGFPRLHVVDTTSPVTVSRLLQSLEPSKTFVIVASKSGTTIEPLSLYAILRSWLDEAVSRARAGRHFIAITDQGSPLERLRQREAMRVTLTAPATVGGRFSALSMFGLAPAALIGVDLEPFVERAQVMERACTLPASDNPGALLGAWMADAYATGRDKLTLVLSPALEPFGWWVEQLIAESLGKDGTGIVPVIEYEPTEPTGYGRDRAVVVVRLASDERLDAWARTVAGEHPVYEITVADGLDIGAEFVRFEYATALAGFLLGLNPFDEPNVAEAKAATLDILEGRAAVPPATHDLDGTWLTYAGALSVPAPTPASRAEALRAWTAAASEGDYLALLAFLPDDEQALAPLRRAVKLFSVKRGCASCFELGPRYLHSTGQLHKGGPASGCFLIITARDRIDVPIPSQRFTLAALHRAQAEGDLVTLAHHDRRVMRVDLPSSSASEIAALADDLVAAAS